MWTELLASLQVGNQREIPLDFIEDFISPSP